MQKVTHGLDKYISSFYKYCVKTTSSPNPVAIFDVYPPYVKEYVRACLGATKVRHYDLRIKMLWRMANTPSGRYAMLISSMRKRNVSHSAVPKIEEDVEAFFRETYTQWFNGQCEEFQVRYPYFEFMDSLGMEALYEITRRINPLESTDNWTKTLPESVQKYFMQHDIKNYWTMKSILSNKDFYMNIVNPFRLPQGEHEWIRTWFL